ncbi:hypothetical protein BMF94_2146 [Rhodotorula taiwanensis]|uniref:CN hydrolase domain-containing protein n=1 Tax=Rhodotorula taiwanensis TaxID=741276 RepID=A0A2S5BDP2_9BASI|nr:hypothetical protein BMF94_2146 [Rhodotorula taiwanensis]
MQERFLRTACMQLSPCFKDWDASRRRADALLADLDADSIDLLVLPEMAFTGERGADVLPVAADQAAAYMLTSIRIKQAIASSPRRTSTRSRNWSAKGELLTGPLPPVRALPECAPARRIGCYVVIGLPIRDASEAAESTPIPERTYRNSVIIVSPEGSLVHVYHKTFLYGELTNDRADYLWAIAGPGFSAVDLPFPPSSPCRTRGHDGPTPATFRLVPAICMDLNMPTFESPFDAFELGTFASEHDADLVVGAMSWLDSEPPTAHEGVGTDEATDDPGSVTEWEQVRQVLSYWVLRLNPLIGSGAAFVCANRIGREGDVLFTGSSCAIELGDRPTVVEHAGKRTERLVLARVALPDKSGSID